MRQALHIFIKDSHYLWREVCLLLALTATLGWVEIHSRLIAWLAEVLWVLAATFIIARVVHADAIPGSNQFWITRPYRWNSMLGAKLLFVLIFVNLPLLMAQVYMVKASDFPVAATLPGLIWSQFLMVLCFSLPAATLAAITPGIAPFLITAFVLLAVELICVSGFLPFLGLTLPFSTLPVGLEPVEWFRKTLAIATFACVEAWVVYGQYRNRQTKVSRICAGGGLFVALLMYLNTPLSVALGVQSRLSKQPVDPSSFGVALDPVRRGVFPMQGRDKFSHVEVILPILVRGLADGTELQADAMAVTIQGVDGRTWNSGLGVVDLTANVQRVAVINRYLLVDPDFFKSESAKPVSIHGALYLTVFGNPQLQTISLAGKPVNVMDSLQCGTGFLNQLYCRSVFRWPRSRVEAKFGQGGTESFTPFVSYSPFPATMAFSPFEQHWVSTSETATQATIITKKTLSHFRRDFEIRDVQIRNFTRATQGNHPVVNGSARP